MQNLDSNRLPLRRRMLYPAELQRHITIFTSEVGPQHINSHDYTMRVDELQSYIFIFSKCYQLLHFTA